MRNSQHSVSLGTFGLAFAIALSPAFMQSDGLTLSCKTGDTRLAELAVEVSGQDRIASFDPDQRAYDVWLLASVQSVVVRAIPMDPGSQVWVNYYSDAGGVGLMEAMIGGGEVPLNVDLGQSTLMVYVRAPGGASDSYALNISDTPVSCEASASEGFRVCVNALNQTRRACYADGDTPCSPDDPGIAAALDALETTVRGACLDGSGALSIDALVQRLQTACDSETMSFASRTFGGPHGAVWATADPVVAEDCLRQPHLTVTGLMDAALRGRNECPANADCSPASLEIIERVLTDAAVAEINAGCDYLDAVIALDPQQYVNRTMAQLDCLTAVSHPNGAPLTLSCGPAVVERDPPPAPAANGYMRIVLDSAVYGTRCGGDTPLFPANNPYAFHVKLAPAGHPVENVLIYLEGGGGCVFETDPGVGCSNRYVEQPELFTALDNEPWTSGIMSDDPAVSPFANWTKVFLPYCTQDLHMGNGVTSYFSSITVHRYGAINTRTALRYVRDLIWRELDAEGGEGFRPDRIKAAFAGFSAGGWGVLYNYHWVLDDLQWPHTAAFPDSALALDNSYDDFWSHRIVSNLLIDGAEPYNWAAKANQPPYCFGPDCVVGPHLITAHSQRLKAVPEQQFMIISNQNDEIGQMQSTFHDRFTINQPWQDNWASDFQQGRTNWINDARRSYCETRQLPGINYFFMPFPQSLHSTTMTDYHLSQVPIDGQTMNNWMADAFVNPDSVADRVEEGNLASFYLGVNPFPCALP